MTKEKDYDLLYEVVFRLARAGETNEMIRAAVGDALSIARETKKEG